jgi:hypothetical protein
VVVESEVIHRHLQAETDENHVKPWDILSPRRDLNPGISEFETGILIT